MVGWDVFGVLVACTAGVGVKIRLRVGRWVADGPRLAMELSHGSWYLRLELGSGPGGVRRRVRRGGFPTRKAAEEELRRLRGPTGSPLTVAEWLARHPSCGARGRNSHRRSFGTNIPAPSQRWPSHAPGLDQTEIYKCGWIISSGCLTESLPQVSCVNCL